MHKSDENREKYQLGDYELIQYQTLQIDIIRIVSQTVKRITNEIVRFRKTFTFGAAPSMTQPR
ncbi:hypothetical protein pdam_00015693, partial [Pocillopora damicornis]